MLTLLKTPIGRLRLIGFLEGISFLVLLFIAMPFKYFAGNPSLVRLLGPVHGLLFCLFVFMALSVAVSHRWPFSKLTWKVLLGSVIPFGTFYVDKRILRSQLAPQNNNNGTVA